LVSISQINHQAAAHRAASFFSLKSLLEIARSMARPILRKARDFFSKREAFIEIYALTRQLWAGHGQRVYPPWGSLDCMVEVHLNDHSAGGYVKEFPSHREGN
jgi:hypothetical protein